MKNKKILEKLFRENKTSPLLKNPEKDFQVGGSNVVDDNVRNSFRRDDCKNRRMARLKNGYKLDQVVRGLNLGEDKTIIKIFFSMLHFFSSSKGLSLSCLTPRTKRKELNHRDVTINVMDRSLKDVRLR